MEVQIFLPLHFTLAVGHNNLVFGLYIVGLLGSKHVEEVCISSTDRLYFYSSME